MLEPKKPKSQALRQWGLSTFERNTRLMARKINGKRRSIKAT